MDNNDAYNIHLENTIQDLQNQISNLNEIVLLLRKQKYGSSSEKTLKVEIYGQLSLFNEAEIEAYASLPKPIVKDVKGYKRKNAKTKREELIKDFPIIEVPCTLPEVEQFCGQCGTPLKVLGTQVMREEMEYIPAKLRIVKYIQTVYDWSTQPKGIRREKSKNGGTKRCGKMSEEDTAYNALSAINTVYRNSI